MLRRRQFLAASLGLATGLGCQQGSQTSKPVGPAQRAADFLLGCQKPDGSWRSDKYSDMASGYELTPMVTKALVYSARDPSAIFKALKFMQNGPSQNLIYPVYTSALMLLLLSRIPQNHKDMGPWRKLLLQYQLAASNGWKPTDLDFGGWGYAMKPPQAGAGDPMAHSNLTSTCFAVGALDVAGGRQALSAAARFVERCRNPKDGGFFATPNDPVLNKAGPGVSYGSATADGLRCLYRVSGKAQPVKAAEQWLTRNFSVEVHPGAFPQSRFEDRDSLFFYYLWSLAHCIKAAERIGMPWPRQKSMLEAMRQRLEKLQNADGSFSNPMGATREDDPLVATPMALAVLQLSG